MNDWETTFTDIQVNDDCRRLLDLIRARNELPSQDKNLYTVLSNIIIMEANMKYASTKSVYKEVLDEYNKALAKEDKKLALVTSIGDKNHGTSTE